MGRLVLLTSSLLSGSVFGTYLIFEHWQSPVYQGLQTQLLYSHIIYDIHFVCVEQKITVYYFIFHATSHSSFCFLWAVLVLPLWPLENLVYISFVQSARFLFGALIRSVRCYQYGQNGPLYQILELLVSKTENGPTYFVGRSRLTTTSFIHDEETSAT